MSSERVRMVGVAVVPVVVLVAVVGVVTDCNTTIVTVAVWQIGLKLLSFEG